MVFDGIGSEKELELPEPTYFTNLDPKLIDMTILKSKELMELFENDIIALRIRYSRLMKLYNRIFELKSNRMKDICSARSKNDSHRQSVLDQLFREHKKVMKKVELGKSHVDGLMLVKEQIKGVLFEIERKERSTTFNVEKAARHMDKRNCKSGKIWRKRDHMKYTAGVGERNCNSDKIWHKRGHMAYKAGVDSRNYNSNKNWCERNHMAYTANANSDRATNWKMISKQHDRAIANASALKSSSNLWLCHC